MTTSYTANLALALPVQGELSGTWGTTVNTSITNMLDEALGWQAYSATGGSDTLTIPDGATGVARSIFIQLNGTGGGTVNVPATKTKMYFVFNNTSTAITFKVTSQTGVSIPAAAKMALVSNGTDIIVAQNYFSALTLGAALPVASGGTGLTAGTSGGVLAYTASGTLASSSALTASALVLGGGAGAAPTPMGSLGTTTTVLHGNVSGAPTFGAVSLTADVSGTLPAANGGTGVANNAASTITISGAFATTLTVSGTTGVTLPTTGTLATLAGTETFTNKTLTNPTLTTPVLGTPTSGNLTTCTADGTNKVGYLNIPLSGIKTASYTLVAGDVGKFIELGTSGTVVVPAGVFTTGDAISIFNNTSASISCTCSAVTTVYKGGTDADIGTFSVTTRGVATILFITATVAVVTGNLA